MSANGSATQNPVTVDLASLENGSVSLEQLEEAFGPSSLGIILVKGLPDRYHELRHNLLSYSSYLANLPQSVLAKLEAPEVDYLIGWSHGKETLKSGQFDTNKGSYYINCGFYHGANATNAPSDNIPAYTAPNIWPPESAIDDFRSCAEELCSLIIDTAALVARACDLFAAKHIPNYEPGYLERVVRTSVTTKARLLHYFPDRNDDPATPPTTESTDKPNPEAEDDWCATHIDHSCLTGLTSAMFVDELGQPPVPFPMNIATPLRELPASPDPRAGLYIHSRSGAVTQVRIPRDALAFQTGEALQRITRGRFAAVPHFVRGVGKGTPGWVARNTLAVFTQPNLDEVVDENGATFADFAREVAARYS